MTHNIKYYAVVGTSISYTFFKHNIMKSYLLTGGTGFIGRNIAIELIKKNNQVRILDNNFRGNLKALTVYKKDFEFLEGDIRDAETVKKACQGIDRVIHLASINGTEFFYTKPEIVLDVSTRGILNIIDACLWQGVSELFIASSSEIYHQPKIVPTPENVAMIIPDAYNPRFSYAGGKIISELLAIHYGKRYLKRSIIFRPHNVYGPEMGWEHVIPQFLIRMKRLASKHKHTLNFPIQGTGRESRSFMYISDFVDGLMFLIKKGKHLETYNIGSQEEITINKLGKEIANIYDRKIKIIPGKIQKGGTHRRVPNISKIKKLGYKNRVSLSKGLLKTARWYNFNTHKLPSVLTI